MANLELHSVDALAKAYRDSIGNPRRVISAACMSGILISEYAGESLSGSSDTTSHEGGRASTSFEAIPATELQAPVLNLSNLTFHGTPETLDFLKGKALLAPEDYIDATYESSNSYKSAVTGEELGAIKRIYRLERGTNAVVFYSHFANHPEYTPHCLKVESWCFDELSVLRRRLQVLKRYFGLFKWQLDLDSIDQAIEETWQQSLDEFFSWADSLLMSGDENPDDLSSNKGFKKDILLSHVLLGDFSDRRLADLSGIGSQDLKSSEATMRAFHEQLYVVMTARSMFPHSEQGPEFKREAEENLEWMLADMERLHSRLAELDPSDAASCFNSAQSLQRDGRIDEALDMYDRCILLDEEDVTNWVEKSLLLYKKQSFPESLDCLRVALNLDERNAISYFVNRADVGTRCEMIIANPQAKEFAALIMPPMRRLEHAAKEPSRDPKIEQPDLDYSPELAIAPEHPAAWEIPPRMAPVEINRLFDSRETFSLSELDTSDETRAHFSAGEGLARVHAAGVLHGDLHPGNLTRFDRATIIDWDGARRVELCPRSMISDFATPLATFEREQLVALLAGYIRSAVVHIEPVYPGYVSEFLELAGGQTEFNLETGRFGFLRLFETAQPSFRVTDGGRIEIAKPQIIEDLLSRLWGEHSDSAVIFLCSLIIAGIDATSLSSRSSFATEDHFWLRFVELCSGQQLKTTDQFRTKIAAIAASFLKALQINFNYPNVESPGNSTPTDLQPDHISSVQLLRTLRDFEVEDSVHFIDGILEALDSLATCFRQESRTVSLNFAQHSAWLMSQTLYDSRHDERRLLNMESRHMQLTRDLFSENCDLGQFFSDVAYANAKGNAFVQAFSESVPTRFQPDGHALWSLCWGTLDLNREIFRQAARFLTGDEDLEEAESSLTKLVSLTADRHYYLLRRNFTGLLFAAELGPAVGSGVVDETKWCVELVQLLSSESILTETGKALFLNGRQFWTAARR